MNTYTAKTGQNIFDIALTLYGSIEGIFDLLVSNSGLSLDTSITKGTVLNYHDSFIINSDIADWLEENNVVVKNGDKASAYATIASQISDWIDSNIQTITYKYANKELSLITSVGSVDTEAEEEIGEATEDTPVLTSLSDDIAEDLQEETMEEQEEVQEAQYAASLVDAPISADMLQEFDDIVGEATDGLSDAVIKENFQQLYINGYVSVPSDKLEAEVFYKSAAVPKIIINQTGSVSTIKCQINQGAFIAIEWGDETDLEFYHYTDYELEIIHNYRISEQHIIKIYGVPNFKTLDFTGLNGIYYATSSISVSSKFTTPYGNATTLNKLFTSASNG